MHRLIRQLVEPKRGCGWRTEPGSLYLTGKSGALICGRLPIPLGACPCCGYAAIAKPARGWTWVDADRLLANAPDCQSPERECRRCPLSQDMAKGLGRAGMIWVGEQFYRTPEVFEREAARMGVSRRITVVPHGFQIGKTYVLLAHRNAILLTPKQMGQKPMFAPGIFRIWRPERIEVIVTGGESDAEIERLVARGMSPVKVIPKGKPTQNKLEGT